MNKESFMLGVSLTCLCVMLIGPKVLKTSHTLCESETDTLKVEVVKPMPNFQLEAHQIKSSLNKSKLKDRRLAKIHGVGFISANTTNRFAILMRELTKRNGGTFLALSF